MFHMNKFSRANHFSEGRKVEGMTDIFRRVLNEALQAAGNQENLATIINISASALSKKINGEAGWYEAEIDKLFDIAGGCRRCKDAHSRRIHAFNEVLKANLDYIEELENGKNGKVFFRREIEGDE